MRNEQYGNKKSYVSSNIGVDTTAVAVSSRRTLSESAKGHLRLACAVLYDALRMHLKYLKHYEVNPDCTCVACKQSHAPVEFLISDTIWHEITDIDPSVFSRVLGDAELVERASTSLLKSYEVRARKPK